MKAVSFCNRTMSLRSWPARLFLLLGVSVAGVGLSAQEAQKASPPATAPPPATTLRALLAEAERANSEILAAEHGRQASQSLAGQAGALPDTQLMLQSFSVGSPRPFAGFSNSDFAYIGFGASQEFPYPGKRALRKESAGHEAASQHAQSEAVRRRVVEQVKTAYFQLSYAQQALGILQRNSQLLADLEQIVESRYRVGQGTQQEILKAQLQRTRMLQEITRTRRDMAQLQVQLKQLLNRPQESPDIVAEPLAPRTVAYNPSELLNRARDTNPLVQARSAMVRKAGAQVALSRKEFRPDFSVQYMFQRTGSSFPAYYMATFGINLPNRSRRKAELAEASEKQTQAAQELEAETQKQLAEVKNQYVMAEASAEQLKIYEQGLIPQSEATFRSALAAYQANRQDFETLLSSFLDLLSLELQQQRELVEHESALARLEALTGVTFP